MLTAIKPLRPEMRLGEAAREITRQRLKSLRWLTDRHRSLEFSHRLTFCTVWALTLTCNCFLNLAETQKTVSRRCRDNSVGEMMSAPVVTVNEVATVNEIIGSFTRHDGRSMPVTNAIGQLRGLLLRKDFVRACRLPGLS